MFYKIKIKHFFDAVIFSNLFISASAVALALCSYIVFYGDISSASFSLLTFIFCSTLIIYNFPIVFSPKDELKNTAKEKWVLKNNNAVKIIFLVSIIGVSTSAVFLSLNTILFLIHLALLSVFYSYPIKIRNIEFAPLRKFPLLKIFILSYVWASATVMVPAFESQLSIGHEVLLCFLERFLFILALAIPFDIRDFVEDKKHNILTIPGLIGIRNSKFLSMFLLLIFLMSSYMGHQFDFIFFSRIISSLIAMLVIYNISKNAKEYAYMFWVDGIMIFQFFILVVMRGG